MTIDFDNFVTCLVRLETMYSECHTFNVFKGTVRLLLYKWDGMSVSCCYE